MWEMVDSHVELALSRARCQEPKDWPGSGPYRGWTFLGENMCVHAFRDMTTISKKTMLKYMILGFIISANH